MAARPRSRTATRPTWGRHLARTRPAPGERDWATKDLAGYLGYFGAAAAPDGPTWYSYDLGSWHIVVLDSACTDVGGCTADSDQGRWLATDLAASKATCTLAIWHRPLTSSGVEGGDPEVAPFWQTLYDAHAEVVVNAHDRDYERFAPQDPAGHADRSAGIRQFVVGTGGAPLAGFGPPATNSEFRLAGEHGVLRLILREKDYAWTFVPSDGTVTDGGQASLPLTPPRRSRRAALARTRGRSHSRAGGRSARPRTPRNRRRAC